MKELMRKGTAGVVASVFALDLLSAASVSASAAPEQTEGPAGSVFAKLSLSELGSFVLADTNAAAAPMRSSTERAMAVTIAELQDAYAQSTEVMQQTTIDSARHDTAMNGR